MKNGGYLIGKPGGKQYKAFAHYLVKFLDAYKAQGVPVWGLTVENEPNGGADPHWGFNSLGFTPELQRDFIKLDLGPILASAGYGLNTTELMVYDDNIKDLNKWVDTILKDKDAAKYVSGTAFHWYQTNDGNIGNVDKAHDTDPTRYLMSTEACQSWNGRDKLGQWYLFERYAYDIIRVCHTLSHLL